jgi:hypothetical protein
LSVSVICLSSAFTRASIELGVLLAPLAVSVATPTDRLTARATTPNTANGLRRK